MLFDGKKENQDDFIINKSPFLQKARFMLEDVSEGKHVYTVIDVDKCKV